MIEEVCRLVLLTKSHSTNPQDYSGKILLDADLAILGSPRAVYEQYAQAIRREYEWVPEAKYRAGRVRILRSFLERPYLYHTNNFRNRLEILARANLLTEIAKLGGEVG
jgi:predicted metal-dependent HD superfamily phosphohydrolase